MTTTLSSNYEQFKKQNSYSSGGGTKSYDQFVSEMNQAGIKTTHINNGEANFADYGNALSDDLKAQIMDSYDCAQDYELWCRAFALGVRFCNLQIPLLYYRCSDQQISSSRRREQGVIAQKIRRKAYDDFSKKRNLGVSMTGLTLTLDNILLLYEKTDLPHKEKSMFLYYLLLSNQSSVISVLLFVCKHNKLYRHLPIINLMRVLYHTMKGSDIRKY